MAAIVDFDERALAFKAVAGAFRHACMIAGTERLQSAPFLGTMIDFVLDGGHGGFHVQNSRKERQCPNHNTCAGSRDCALYAGWLLLEVKPERGVDLNTADNSVTSNW